MKGFIVFLKDGIPIAIIIVMVLGFFGLIGWSSVQFTKKGYMERVYLEGRLARENGHSIQSNGYVEQEYRDEWRRGWRAAQVIKE